MKYLKEHYIYVTRQNNKLVNDAMSYIEDILSDVKDFGYLLRIGISNYTDETLLRIDIRNDDKEIDFNNLEDSLKMVINYTDTNCTTFLELNYIGLRLQYIQDIQILKLDSIKMVKNRLKSLESSELIGIILVYKILITNKPKPSPPKNHIKSLNENIKSNDIVDNIKDMLSSAKDEGYGVNIFYETISGINHIDIFISGNSIDFDKISDDLEMIDNYLYLEYDKNIEMKYITIHLKEFEGRYWYHDCTYTSLKKAKEDSDSYKSGTIHDISIRYNHTEK